MEVVVIGVEMVVVVVHGGCGGDGGRDGDGGSG